MGAIVRGHIIVLSGLVIAFLVISGRKIELKMLTPQQYDISCDEQLSEKGRLEVLNFIETLDKRLALKADIFSQIIQEKFPFIRSVELRLVPPGRMKLTCHVQKPIGLVNENFLLVPPRSLCSRDYFQQAICSSLPCMAIHETCLMRYEPAKIVAVMGIISQDTFDRYQVSWSDNGTIFFHDKEQPLLTLICRFDKVPTKKLCLYGAHIRDMLTARGAFSGKIAAHYVADLRFEKQIILSKNKEQGRGKSIF